MGTQPLANQEKTSIFKFCVDTGCCLEDLLSAMADGERVSGMHALCLYILMMTKSSLRLFSQKDYSIPERMM